MSYKLPVALTLPQTPELARQLLQHYRGPAHLGQNVSVEATAPWHIDLLADADLRDSIGSVNVRQVASIQDVFTTLQELQHLKTLRIFDRPRRESTGKIIYSKNRVSLAHECLRVLVLEDVQPGTVHDLGGLPQLRELQVLAYCTLPRVSDLFPCLNTNPRVLKLIEVETLEEPSEQDKRELLRRLAHETTNLTSVQLKSRQLLRSSSATLQSKMASVVEIKHHIKYDFEALAPLVHVQGLNVRLHVSEPQDFGVLRRLTMLTKVYITPPQFNINWAIRTAKTRNAKALVEVLHSLPLVKHIECHLFHSIVLDKMDQLESLMLVGVPEAIRKLDSFASLRKLDLRLDSNIDASISFAHLSCLEDLSLDTSWRCFPVSSAMVAPLINLRKLTIAAPFHDWSGLGNLTKLRDLSIYYRRGQSPPQDGSELRGFVESPIRGFATDGSPRCLRSGQIARVAIRFHS